MKTYGLVRREIIRSDDEFVTIREIYRPDPEGYLVFMGDDYPSSIKITEHKNLHSITDYVEKYHGGSI